MTDEIWTPAGGEIEIEKHPLDVVKPGELVNRTTIANCLLVLAGFGDLVRFDEFSRRIMCSGLGTMLPPGEWTDEYTSAFVAFCEKQFQLYISPSTADRAIALHAKRHAYNALINYVLACAAKWDGVPRVDRAFVTYWRAADTEATRIASRVFFLSLAARALMPGCKVDTCVTFIAPQGVRKSSALSALVGAEHFADSHLPIGEKDGMQLLAGVWLWEFSEQATLARKEQNQVKAFLSSQTDRFRPSYGRHWITVPRQTCFAASTNDIENLTDTTGNRRFLPVVPGMIDVDAIARDREQLLGEAAHRVASGERYWLDAEDDAALAGVRATHEVHDAWGEPIAEWLAWRGRCLGDKPFSTADIFALSTGAVPIDTARLDKREMGRAAAVLRKLGYVKIKETRGPDRDKHRWYRAAQVPGGAPLAPAKSQSPLAQRKRH